MPPSNRSAPHVANRWQPPLSFARNVATIAKVVVKFESHKTAGVDIDHGTLALQKAETDMFEAAEMQRKLASGPGLPWWGLALVLFVLGSGLVIATLAVNASRRVDATAPANPMALFLTLTAVAFGLAPPVPM